MVPRYVTAGSVFSATHRFTYFLQNNAPAVGLTVNASVVNDLWVVDGYTGTLSGTLSAVTDSDGVATFNNLSIDKPGNKRIKFVPVDWSPQYSEIFSVIKNMVFSQQPTNTNQNTAINPPVVVQLKHDDGSDSLVSGLPITLSLTSGTGTLSGTLTLITSGNGRAVFTDLSINLAEELPLTKKITATEILGTSIESEPFTIFTGDHIDFIQQPTNTKVGYIRSVDDYIYPSIIGQLKFPNGTDYAEAGAAITIALNSGVGVLEGTLTKPTGVSGFADFSDLSITLYGKKTLSITTPGYATTISDTFHMLGPLRFVQIPLNPQIQGVAITPPVSLRLKDTEHPGPYYTDVLQAGVPITVSLATGTGTLSGTLTQNTNAEGIATFSDLVIDTPGFKSITGEGLGLTPTTSPVFVVNAFFIPFPPNAPTNLILTVL